MVERKLLQLLAGAPAKGSHERPGRPADGKCLLGVKENPPPRRILKEDLMRTVQEGDRVLVHYVKRFQDGHVVSSCGKPPTPCTVGVEHPRLPGLGMALVGLAVGECKVLQVPAAKAHGRNAPGRLYRLAAARFTGHKDLAVGKWVRLWDRHQRRRLVRVVALREDMVVVSTQHPRASQSLVLEVEVVAIAGPEISAAVGKTPGAAEPTPDGASGITC
jgi:peptidylprolyl isomerase